LKGNKWKFSDKLLHFIVLGVSVGASTSQFLVEVVSENLFFFVCQRLRTTTSGFRSHAWCPVLPCQHWPVLMPILMFAIGAMHVENENPVTVC